jgi:hypothetical protein
MGTNTGLDEVEKILDFAATQTSVPLSFSPIDSRYTYCAISAPNKLINTYYWPLNTSYTNVNIHLEYVIFGTAFNQTIQTSANYSSLLIKPLNIRSYKCPLVSNSGVGFDFYVCNSTIPVRILFILKSSLLHTLDRKYPLKQHSQHWAMHKACTQTFCSADNKALSNKLANRPN